jgi:hypothetical protein
LDEISHFERKSACFGTGSGVHYIWRVTGSEMSVIRRNIFYVKEVTVEFRQNCMKDRILRESGLFSELEVACTTFGVSQGVK